MKLTILEAGCFFLPFGLNKKKIVFPELYDICSFWHLQKRNVQKMDQVEKGILQEKDCEKKKIMQETDHTEIDCTTTENGSCRKWIM